MIEGKKVLAVIPARGGSKGVPRKNIREVGGKPLIAWTIESAKKSSYIDRLIVSSEDAEIIDTCQKWGCEAPFVRPIELAQDDTPGVEPVLHAVETLNEKYDYVVLLQPTSPLRTTKDIDGCIELCHIQGASSCVTVCESAKSPYWMYRLDEKNSLCKLFSGDFVNVRRQDLPKVYVLNGAVYVVTVEWLKHVKSLVGDTTQAYIMPSERSLDVDTEFDLQFLEYLLLHRI